MLRMEIMLKSRIDAHHESSAVPVLVRTIRCSGLLDIVCGEGKGLMDFKDGAGLEGYAGN